MGTDHFSHVHAPQEMCNEARPSLAAHSTAILIMSPVAQLFPPTLTRGNHAALHIPHWVQQYGRHFVLFVGDGGVRNFPCGASPTNHKGPKVQIAFLGEMTAAHPPGTHSTCLGKDLEEELISRANDLFERPSKDAVSYST